ncbi:MAG: nucleoside recognition protein [Deltaproteobacteria bacterium]|nr:nucleoside recognition protein [Deltaproteobacteria bacterium]
MIILTVSSEQTISVGLAKQPPLVRRSTKQHRGSSSLWAWVILAVVIAGVFWAGPEAGLIKFFRPHHLWSRLVDPLLRSMTYIALGLLAGQVIESLGWTNRLGRLVWPLIKWARLPGPAGTAFIAAFVSGVLANTLLYTSWQEGRLNRRGLILGNLLCNSLPIYFLHLPTTLFITLSLTGQAGMLYMLLMFMAAVLRLVGTTLVSRLFMPECPTCELDQPPEKRPWKEIWMETWPKFRQRLWRLTVIIVPVYLAVSLMAEAGVFTWMRDASTKWISGSFLPVESMGLVIFAVMAEFTTGFAAAGALLQAGAMTIKQTVFALLIGNVVATPVRALRHQLPQYMGIYTPGMGLQIMILTQVVRVISVILVALGFFWIY